MNKSQGKTVSRGYFLRSASLITAGILLSPRETFAQDSLVSQIINTAAKSPIVVHPLRGNVAILEGSGGNIAAFSGKDGFLLVDAGLSVSKKKILSALARISDKPISYLVNTHWHFDHADGNEWMHKTGATLIAQENTKLNLGKTIRIEDWNYTFKAHNAEGIPTITFSEQYTFPFNGSSLQMKHFPSAHTNGDLSVYFPEADIIHVADIWWNAHYPYIDLGVGGSLDGVIQACNYIINHATEKTIIIPGHGAYGNKSQLSAYRDMLITVKDKVSKLKLSGRTSSETIASKPTAEFDARYGGFIVNGDFFTKIVYATV